jgi:hypothetical protein
MNDNRKYTAFCGLYCKDCIPSNSELFRLTKRLSELLDDLGFEHYAELKSKRNEEFLNYETFRKLLTEIQKLKCDPNCFEGPVSELGCSENCERRQCVIKKEIPGCWECAEYKECTKLEWHKKFHPGMEKNLDMIKEFGLDNWLDKRGKHYTWSK